MNRNLCSLVLSRHEILRRDQDDKFALETGFGEACLDVAREADEEGLVQLRNFLRDADDAIGAEDLDDFLRELVDAVAALVEREREVEIAILVEKVNSRGRFRRQETSE